jgi:hypothetical protein
LLEIGSYEDVEVKFDNYDKSDTMNIETFTDSDDVYIGKSQFSYSNQLPYDEFIRRLQNAKAVSVQVESRNAGTHWITFTLNGSREALGVLYGTEQSAEVDREN